MLQEVCFLKRDMEKVCLAGEDMEGFEKRIDVKMLLNNEIPGFLPLRIQYIDEKSVYSYSIQGMTPLDELLKTDKLDFFLAEKIYQGILSAQRRGQEFFLDASHFVLEPSCLFWNNRKKKLMICYFPGYQLSLDEQMSALGRFLLKHTDHKDKRCVSFVYGIYELMEGVGFADADIAGYLREFCGREIKHTEEGDGKRGKGEEGKKRPARGNRTKQEETVVGMRNLSKWRGLPDWVEVCRDSFTIGRSRDNDFVIPAVWISLHHARIDRKQSQIYITDLGSANGVYLNGKKLISNHPALCREKDVISFADISFCLEEQDS